MTDTIRFPVVSFPDVRMLHHGAALILMPADASGCQISLIPSFMAVDN